MNALKSYIDMKFDVLKGMMDKSLTRTANTGVVEESKEEKLKMQSYTKRLSKSMTHV